VEAPPLNDASFSTLTIGLAAIVVAGPIYAAPAVNEVVYRARIVGDTSPTRRLEVFDLDASMESDADVRYLEKRNPKYLGDLGGKFTVCSDEKFWCIDAPGSLHLALPRDLAVAKQSSWSFAGLSCRADTTRSPARAAVAIVCHFGEHFAWAAYTPERGIISFSRSLEADVAYELVGEAGLFAAPR